MILWGNNMWFCSVVLFFLLFFFSLVCEAEPLTVRHCLPGVPTLLLAGRLTEPGGRPEASSYLLCPGPSCGSSERRSPFRSAAIWSAAAPAAASFVKPYCLPTWNWGGGRKRKGKKIKKILHVRTQRYMVRRCGRVIEKKLNETQQPRF